jgi:enolase
MIQNNKIVRVYAREVLDSRGNPTLEATVELKSGITASAKVPSGASTGVHEALELRDGDKTRFGGLGVLRAVSNVNDLINPVLKGVEIEKLTQIDQRMIDLDGTENKSRLGANAILGVSLACARAGALANNEPLYKFIRRIYKLKLKNFIMPTPLVNVMNGGKHANSNLDFQEFWIIPQGVNTFKEKIRAAAEIFHKLGGILLAKGYDTDFGDEGGYAPNVKSVEEVWQMMKEATKKANYELGKDVWFGIDSGSSSFYNKEKKVYELKHLGKDLTAEELSLLYQRWIADYSFLAFEDPFAEDEWEVWRNFKHQVLSINSKLLVIGDDLLTTNVSLLTRGLKEDSANGIIIKLNQIGTLTETINCLNLARSNGYKIIISHRSGETEDDFIADLAVAVNADYIKAGATSRSERVAKYNRLMEIETKEG